MSGPRRRATLGSVQIIRALAAMSVCVGHALHEASRFPGASVFGCLDAMPWAIGVDVFFMRTLAGLMACDVRQARSPQPAACRRTS